MSLVQFFVPGHKHLEASAGTLGLRHTSITILSGELFHLLPSLLLTCLSLLTPVLILTLMFVFT